MGQDLIVLVISMLGMQQLHKYLGMQAMCVKYLGDLCMEKDPILLV